MCCFIDFMQHLVYTPFTVIKRESKSYLKSYLLKSYRFRMSGKSSRRIGRPKTGYQFMDSKSERNTFTRRGLLKAMAGAGAAMMAAPMTNRGRYRIFAGSPIEYSARAIELVKRAT